MVSLAFAAPTVVVVTGNYTPTVTFTPAATATTITPTPTPSPSMSIVQGTPATLKWTDTAATPATLTSAYVGDTVRYNFAMNSNVSPNDRLYVYMFRENPYTGSWDWYMYAPFNATISGSTSAPVYYPGYITGLSGNTSLWRGYYDIVLADYPSYKFDVYGYNTSSGIFYNYGNSSITVTNNPLQATNLGDWLDDIGGDGLRYFIGVLIILFFLIIPYWYMRTMNIYMEIVMVAFAIGINYLFGLFDLWVVVAIGVGAVALYVLISSNRRDT